MAEGSLEFEVWLPESKLHRETQNLFRKVGN